MRQYELNSKAMSYIVMVQLYVELGNDYNVLFVERFLLFPCSAKSFLIKRTKLL